MDNASPLTLLQAFLPTLQLDETAPTFGEGSEITISGKSAAQATGSDAYDGRAIMIDIGGSYLLAVALSAKGEMPDWSATIDAILASATYTMPAG